MAHDVSFSSRWEYHDGYWVIGAGSGTSNSQFNTMGNVSGTSYGTYGLCATVTIPAGSTITNAYVRFKAYENCSGTTCNLNVYFADVDNATSIIPLSNPDSLPLTDPVAWDAEETWTAGNIYDTPDISSILQDVIDRGGWASGNSVMFVVKDNSSDSGAYRKAHGAYDISRSITAITRANPCQITVSSTIANTITSTIIAGITQGEWSALNGGEKLATYVDANNFTVPIDTSGYSAEYSDGGGSCTLYGWSNDATLYVSYQINEDVEITESFSVSFGLDETAQCVMEESFSVDDAILPQWAGQGELGESFSVDDTNQVSMDVNIAESFTVDDVYTPNWVAFQSMSESFSSDDTLTVLWEIYQTESESFNVDDLFATTTTNVFGRVREATNLSANRVSMKFQNNTADQDLVLHDFGALTFVNQEYYDFNHPVNLSNQHVQLKIEHNTVDETMELFDIGFKIFGYMNR